MDATAVVQHRPLFDATTAKVTAANLKPRISSSNNGTVFDANKVRCRASRSLAAHHQIIVILTHVIHDDDDDDDASFFL
jgi:hypothetical protein